MSYLYQLNSCDTPQKDDDLDHESEFYNVTDPRIIDMLAEAGFYSINDDNY